MRERAVYLDSSSLVKRYIGEVGSDEVDEVYDKSESGELKAAFSIWNLGEAIGVFDRYLSRNLISHDEFLIARSDLVSETLKLSRLESLAVLPVTSMLLVESWSLVAKHHIYEADALQIASSKEVSCSLFLGADKRLVDAALAEGLKAVNVEAERSLEF